MVAREEVRIPEQEHRVAARVARGRDREEVVREMDGLVAFQRALGRLSERGGIPRVNDAAAAERFRRAA